MRLLVEQAATLEANGWKLSNATLCSLVESHLNMPGLSSVNIGRAAAGLD